MDDVYRLQLQSSEARAAQNHGIDPLITLPPAYRDGERPLPEKKDHSVGYGSGLDRLNDAVQQAKERIVDTLADGGSEIILDRYVTREPLFPMCAEQSGDAATVDRLDFYVIYETRLDLTGRGKAVVSEDELHEYSEQMWGKIVDVVNEEFCDYQG